MHHPACMCFDASSIDIIAKYRTTASVKFCPLKLVYVHSGTTSAKILLLADMCADMAVLL